MTGEKWLDEPLTMVVLGASGDLAKKKTFPALYDLFLEDKLPANTIIIGYARSKLSNKKLYEKLRPFLRKRHPNIESKLHKFCNLIHYQQGQYDSGSDIKKALATASNLHGKTAIENRVFYFALPPSTFIPAAASVKEGGMSSTGFTRLIVEKPFGHDTKSAQDMGVALGKLFPEEYLYRIDHYLGKEMVQAMLTLRFSNAWLEPLLNNQNVKSVMISFKEDIGTMGRGGYFDKSGIIRDIMQNHLMQVLSILAMEPPQNVVGEKASDLIRDEKVKVLKAIKPWKAEDTVLGQYVGNGKEKGYLEDETVPKGSLCPTYACTVFKVNNRRWSGVPFIMRAGKALDERKCEVRIQLKPPSGVAEMFHLEDENDTTPLNEIVVRIQPNEAVWLKSNVKTPGLSNNVEQTYLDLTLKERYKDLYIPDAYTRLILDVLKGQQQNFVRNDELIEAWKIVTPLLQDIEKSAIKPTKYVFGTRGPEEANELIRTKGKYVYTPSESS